MPDDWVPVEEGRIGLDRRTIAPARRQNLLSPGVSFVLAHGWSLRRGERADERTANAVPSSAVVVGGGLTLTIDVGPLEDGPASLLKQVQKTTTATDPADPHVVGKSAALTTDNGEDGLVARCDTASTKGAIAGLRDGGNGAEVVATGTSLTGRKRSCPARSPR